VHCRARKAGIPSPAHPITEKPMPLNIMDNRGVALERQPRR